MLKIFHLELDALWSITNEVLNFFLCFILVYVYEYFLDFVMLNNTEEKDFAICLKSNYYLNCDKINNVQCGK